MLKALRLTAVCFVAVLTACSTTNSKVSSNTTFEWTSPTRRVLLIKPDITLGELSAGGTMEPRADWTATAENFIAQDISSHFGTRSAELVPVNTITDPHEAQLTRLHNVVGHAILTHLYTPSLALYNKGKALDWTLGSGATALRDRYGADYALFVHVEDTYSTAGRTALIIGAAILGVGVHGGQQTGFASLVDLRTGNIVWFNQLTSSKGDLRTAVPAQKTVDALLTGIPL